MFRMVLSIAAAAFLLAAYTPAASAAQSKPDARTAAAKPTGGKPLNINTASVAELDALPGIGAKTAALIVEYRQKNGPFKKIEDFREAGAGGHRAWAANRHSAQAMSSIRGVPKTIARCAGTGTPRVLGARGAETTTFVLFSLIYRSRKLIVTAFAGHASRVEDSSGTKEGAMRTRTRWTLLFISWWLVPIAGLARAARVWRQSVAASAPINMAAQGSR